ncbi:MAG: porin family protein [Calditrichaeota bacterium]|nr:porin family protein [Calditrichota bacterium]
MKTVLFALLMSACALPLFAQGSDMGFQGIGVRLGIVNPEGDWKPAPEFGVSVDLGSPIENVYVDGAISYWSSELDANLPTGYTYSLSDIALRVGAKYRFLSKETSPYFGGGIGYHLYDLTVETPSGQSSSALLNDYTQDDEGTLYLVGGIEHIFSDKFIGSAEVRMDIADLTQTAIHANLGFMIGH